MNDLQDNGRSQGDGPDEWSPGEWPPTEQSLKHADPPAPTPVPAQDELPAPPGAQDPAPVKSESRRADERRAMWARLRGGETAPPVEAETHRGVDARDTRARRRRQDTAPPVEVAPLGPVDEDFLAWREPDPPPRASELRRTIDADTLRAPPDERRHERRIQQDRIAWWALIPALVLGGYLRFVALPLPGTGDVDIWKVWSFSASRDLAGVYGVGGTPPERRVLHWQGSEMTVDYPPASLEQLAVAGWLYGWRHPLFEDSVDLNIAVKLPGLMWELLFVAAALTWGRRRFGAAAATWVALSLWLNPGVILDGPVLGYLDPEMALPAAMALAAAWTGAGFVAGALAAVAVLTKAQAVFVLPAIAAALVWRRRNAHGGAFGRAVLGVLGGAGIGTLVVLPYVLRGAWTNLVQAVGRVATHDMLSANAANAWWLTTWVLRVQDVIGDWGWWRAITQETRILAISRVVALGYPNPRWIGLGLVAVACASAAWRMRRATSLADAAAFAGWSAYAYALLATQVHENHLFLALPFFCIAAGLDDRYGPALFWISAVFTLNLLLFYGLGRDVSFVLDRSWTRIDASVLLAALNIFVFLGTTKTVARIGHS